MELQIQLSLYFTTLYFKTTLIIRTLIWSQLCVLLNLHFKTTCSIRPHFHGRIGGLKIEGPLYCDIKTLEWRNHFLVSFPMAGSVRAVAHFGNIQFIYDCLNLNV